jgi:hypothetical protein
LPRRKWPREENATDQRVETAPGAAPADTNELGFTAVDTPPIPAIIGCLTL